MVAWDEDWEIGRRDVTIRVADSNDGGTISLSHVRPQVGTPITATLKDQDDISTSPTWQWYRGLVAGGIEADGPGANTATYTPIVPPDTNPDNLVTDVGVTLYVTATYTDGGGNAEVAQGMASTTVRANPLGVDEENTADVDESGVNTPPKFYEDGVDASVLAERLPEDEVTRYTRYVLENHSTHLTKTELEARVDIDDDADSPGIQVPNTGLVNVFDGFFENQEDRVADPQEVTADSHNLQFDLRGADAKYFKITQSTGNSDDPLGGLISTKRALDFETDSTYTVTVRATDPAGLFKEVAVDIEVLDVPEIQGLAQRIRVDENTRDIADLHNSYATKTNLGGLKWSLLTVDEPADTPANNRIDPRSIDCQFDEDNQNLCDDFKFSQFNGSDTTLEFAIGTGETHDTPNFEKPADVGTEEENDNVYKIVVRVAFANLRSFPEDNPAADERNDREVWIRVDDVDEAPSFADDASTRLIAENSDDFLPSYRDKQGRRWHGEGNGPRIR